jgi:hypothetical protein
VTIPPLPGSDAAALDQAVIDAVAEKAELGAPYATDKYLIIFFDTPIKEWHPVKVAREIKSKHAFVEIWATQLKSHKDGAYTYNVTQLDSADGDTPSWEVEIYATFTTWRVARVR